MERLVAFGWRRICLGDHRERRGNAGEVDRRRLIRLRNVRLRVPLIIGRQVEATSLGGDRQPGSDAGEIERRRERDDQGAYRAAGGVRR